METTTAPGLSILRQGMLLVLATFLPLLLLQNSASAQESDQVMRVARLQIDTAQLQAYKAALKEEITLSLRLEPGVLAFYAVSETKTPSQITIFEVYADVDAYRIHLETPHYKKYKSLTQNMVSSLDFVQVDAILFGTKTIKAPGYRFASSF
ncbi:MAG TPA: antibiotic biosynthesis monooxygenase family protein [Puia sp.]|jgi:quinol monooxygenase YgiN|nr:antibiotic biosynthesis monooxygenase family protein [Puia sp.]